MTTLLLAIAAVAACLVGGVVLLTWAPEAADRSLTWGWSAVAAVSGLVCVRTVIGRRGS